MSKVILTNHSKKQRKEVKKNPRWHSVFRGEVPFPDSHRSSWEYVISCFLDDEPIPDCFYGHSITLTAQQKSRIKNRLGSLNQAEIKGLGLHFDGHSGDHLLLCIRTNQGIVHLVGIGTHPDLLQLYLERSFAHDISKKHCSLTRIENQEVKQPHSSRRHGIQETANET